VHSEVMKPGEARPTDEGSWQPNQPLPRNLVHAIGRARMRSPPSSLIHDPPVDKSSMTTTATRAFRSRSNTFTTQHTNNNYTIITTQHTAITLHIRLAHLPPQPPSARILGASFRIISLTPSLSFSFPRIISLTPSLSFSFPRIISLAPHPRRIYAPYFK